MNESGKTARSHRRSRKAGRGVRGLRKATALALTCLVAALATAGQAPSAAESMTLAQSGDPVAYGRLWAFSQRCKIDQGLAGAAAGRVGTTAARTGRAANFDDFFERARPGLRQGNEVPISEVDCAATNRALETLAGLSPKDTRPAPDYGTHTAVIGRRSCPFQPDSAVVRMMTAYLIEKNAMDGRDITADVNLRLARLTDTFIAPQYLERYRVTPGTAQLDTKGSRPERLICVDGRGSTPVAITALSNPESGWTAVMEYRLAEEKGRLYILPTEPPFEASLRPIRYGNDPTRWISPMTVVDGHPREKN